MATVRLTGVTKRFDRLTAVDNIDLDVDAGEVVCLLGPSGCGKTTTLRMIAGLEGVTAGDIYFGDWRVNDVAPRKRNAAMVFQFYALYPTLTVAENLTFPLYADRLGQDDIAARVARTLDLLRLADFADRLPAELAEGEKQRVAVGRAIIRDPNCFLFDEPLSRLDVQLRETMRGQIKELLAGLSKATVIVTHDQLEALTMADRIAVMRAGVIEQFDTPHRVFTEPANLFVAGFIGTPQMNLLPATVLESDREGHRLRIADQTVALDLGVRAGTIATGEAVTVGIRPRNLAPASAPDDGALSAVVDIVEPMGAETLLHLHAGEQQIRMVIPRGIEARPGEAIGLEFQPRQVHLFDAHGRRLGK